MTQCKGEIRRHEGIFLGIHHRGRNGGVGAEFIGSRNGVGNLGVEVWWTWNWKWRNGVSLSFVLFTFLFLCLDLVLEVEHVFPQSSLYSPDLTAFKAQYGLIEILLGLLRSLVCLLPDWLPLRVVLLLCTFFMQPVTPCSRLLSCGFPQGSMSDTPPAILPPVADIAN